MTKLVLYIDGGKEVIMLTTSATPDTGNTSPFVIGKNSWTGDPDSRFFKGNADEVRVWNRALTAQEVADAYNGGTFNTSGQLIYKSKSNDYFNAQGDNYDDIAEDSSSIRLTTFSAATWFKTSEDYKLLNLKRLIINKQGFGNDANGTNMNYGIWMDFGAANGNKIQAGFEDCCDGSPGTDIFVRSTNTYNDGKWHYAVVTFDNANDILSLYIDGILVASTTSTSTPDTGTADNFKPFRAGANSWTTPSDRFFIGQIDEVRLWNRVLTANEISDQYDLSIFDTNGQLVYKNYGGE
jgi:hypothetical protein